MSVILSPLLFAYNNMVREILVGLAVGVGFAILMVCCHVLIAAGGMHHWLMPYVTGGAIASLTAFCMIRHIRAAESHQKWLVSELNHHINNALQVLMCRSSIPDEVRETRISEACKRIQEALRLTSSGKKDSFVKKASA